MLLLPNERSKRIKNGTIVRVHLIESDGWGWCIAKILSSTPNDDGYRVLLQNAEERIVPDHNVCHPPSDEKLEFGPLSIFAFPGPGRRTPSTVSASEMIREHLEK